MNCCSKKELETHPVSDYGFQKQFWCWMKTYLCCCEFKCTKLQNNQAAIRQIIYNKNHTTHRRLLLIGPAGSGKSTIINQMRLLYGNGFSDQKRRKAICNIRRNLVQTIWDITRAIPVLNPPVALQRSENKEKLKYLQDYQPDYDCNCSSEFYDYAADILEDEGFQIALQRGNEYQLLDCAKYLLDKIDTIKQADYLPSDQDILRCDILIGNSEVRFYVEKFTFDIFHAGCVRNSPKLKHYFTCKTVVIFVAACGSYDTSYRDDRKTNLLKESLELFSDILKNKWIFDKNSIILFLNKEDQLSEKILAGRSKLEDCFPDFREYQIPVDVPYKTKDPHEVTRAKYFIRDMFIDIFAQFSDDTGNCYTHFTCAIDTDNIKQVFVNCYDIIHQMHITYYNQM